MAERSLLQRFDQAGPLTWLLAAGAGWAVLLWIGALLGMLQEHMTGFFSRMAAASSSSSSNACSGARVMQ